MGYCTMGHNVQRYAVQCAGVQRTVQFLQYKGKI
jgi:hypothetical protein